MVRGRRRCVRAAPHPLLLLLLQTLLLFFSTGVVLLLVGAGHGPGDRYSSEVRAGHPPIPITGEALLAGDPQRVARVFRARGMEDALAAVWREWSLRAPPKGRYVFPNTLHELFAQIGNSVTDRSISSFCCNSHLAQIRARKNVSIGVFGGSVTAGSGCTSQHGKCSWPQFLELMLKTLGWDATVHNCAVGGTTTDQSVELVLARACGAYDIYIVAHGANDDVEFSENYVPENSTERAAHMIQDLVHAVRETVNNSLVMIWDEMPAHHFLQTQGLRFENAMVAHQIGAASVAAPSLSFFQSLYLADYMPHYADRLYFRSDQVHPHSVAFLLIASVLADYIVASPLSMPPPAEHHVVHSCDRELVLATANERGFLLSGTSGNRQAEARGLTVTQSGWSVQLDTHGRANWISSADSQAWVQFDFPWSVRDIAIVHMKSYGSEWGEFAVSADKNSRASHTVQSQWTRQASIFTRAHVDLGVTRRVRLQSLGGKNQVRSISFCRTH